MARKTKYCLNYAKGRHLNDGKSPSHMHCSECYEEVKERYASIQANGGALEGLRAARTLAGGSFGYENNERDKERNLRAFFWFVMPEVHQARVDKLVKEMSISNKVTVIAQGGVPKTVIMYDNTKR